MVIDHLIKQPADSTQQTRNDRKTLMKQETQLSLTNLRDAFKVIQGHQT